MKAPALSPVSAAAWGGLIAGILDIGAVCAYWWFEAGVPPGAIFQSIASALMGAAAFGGGSPAVLLGVVLHFAVSFAFAGAYAFAGLRVRALVVRPVLYGIAYGLLAHLIMSRIVVPLSRAEFGGGTPTPKEFAASMFIHLFLFGLPIALVASRMRRRP
ncbi:hypothetical protein H0E84_03590 [Luteimonas sp. SJ-92]|uniref:DUF1440 domain-containing protein n=1 Tax=Luteimonas salinisoli TaxID=2752307 RepID=A0A853J9B9_9GAMM|nr:hypothetical protein [Luteimonas salinisoli]NZA25455.1 hypothetical protein [Luteimonas salinisoli]